MHRALRTSLGHITGNEVLLDPRKAGVHPRIGRCEHPSGRLQIAKDVIVLIQDLEGKVVLRADGFGRIGRFRATGFFLFGHRDLLPYRNDEGGDFHDLTVHTHGTTFDQVAGCRRAAETELGTDECMQRGLDF